MVIMGWVSGCGERVVVVLLLIISRSPPSLSHNPCLQPNPPDTPTLHHHQPPSPTPPPNQSLQSSITSFHPPPGGEGVERDDELPPEAVRDGVRKPCSQIGLKNRLHRRHVLAVVLGLLVDDDDDDQQVEVESLECLQKLKLFKKKKTHVHNTGVCHNI